MNHLVEYSALLHDLGRILSSPPIGERHVRVRAIVVVYNLLFREEALFRNLRRQPKFGIIFVSDYLIRGLATLELTYIDR